MKLGNIVLLGLGGYALYYYSRLALAGNDLQVVFKGFGIQSISNYTITLTVQNTSNALIVLNSLAADVQINDSDLGNVSYFGSPIQIPANSQVDVPLTLNVSLLGVPAIVTQMLNNTGTYTINVLGTLNANGVVLPLKLSTSFNLGKAA
jgi:purine-nucleoside phosphorylase